MKSLHLLYHELRPEPSDYTYVTPCAEFETHCALFQTLRASQAAGYLQPEVTFDDGHRSDVEFALPILMRFGLRAHFFITAGWTGQRAGFMQAHDLRSLHAAGHRVGAHGWSHKLLTTCTTTELEEELLRPKRALEDTLGAAVTTMSLPGGRANRRVLAACEQAGYAQVFTSVPRAEELQNHPRAVGRLNLRGGTTVDWLQRVLQPGTGALARLYRADRAKGAAKAVLGDRLYGGLWALVNRQEPDAADAGAPDR